MKTAVLVLLLLACSVARVETPPSPEAEKQALYKLVDSFGLSIGLLGQFGQVMTMPSGSHGDYAEGYGFLESRRGKTFTVLMTDLSEVEYTSGNDPYMAGVQATSRPLDFRKFLDNERDTCMFASDMSPWLIDQFLFACEADLHGWPDLGEFFYKHSTQMGNPADPEDPHSIPAQLAALLLSHTKVLYANPGVSRAQLMARLRSIQDRFPWTAAAKEAAGMSEILQSMADEDATRNPLTPAQVSMLPREDQVKELIWQLRDQDGLGEPDGPTDLFQTHAPAGPSPAERLAAMGMVAVPPLLEALDDTRPTRTVGGGLRYPQPVTEIRDAAIAILDRIAGRSFEFPISEQDPITEAEWATRISAANGWWSDVQRLGEEQVLLSEVWSARYPEAADRLAKLYPQDALAAIKSCYQLSSNDQIQDLLVEAVGLLHSPDAYEFSKKQMLQGSTISVRLAAALNVWHSEPLFAARCMLEEWRKLAPAARRIDLTAFLLQSGDAHCVTQVAAGISREPVDLRQSAVWSLGDSFADNLQSPSAYKTGSSYATACEDFLAGRLKDAEEVQGGLVDIGHHTLSPPRACDLACCIMSSLWPGKYTCVPEARRVRDNCCLTALRIWRNSRAAAHRHASKVHRP